MGARSFGIFVASDNLTDPTSALAQAVYAAEVEHGRDGYTGTIAEKGECIILHADPITPEEMRDLIARNDQGKVDEVFDKWGPVGAVRYDLPIRDGTTAPGWMFIGWASS